MKEPSNPFTIRTTENIESELTFLKLFGSTVLDVLSDDCFSNKVTIFRSGPGGGKTSLLRLFRPESLNIIFERRVEYKELYKSLKEFSVLSDNGPDILGIYLKLSDYATFEDLDIEDNEKNKYLFSLIGARLILKMLMGILALKKLELSDLDKIQIEKPTEREYISILPLPCNGKQLYDWASKLEQNICEAVNRFDGVFDKSIALFRNLEHVYAIMPKNIKFEDEQIISKILIMLDDLQHLRKHQREEILKQVIEARYPMATWFAERLEALNLQDMIPGIEGREYKPVYLEMHWEKSNGKAFEIFARTISEKRAQFAKLEFEFNSIHEHLEKTIDNTKLTPKFVEIIDEIKERLYNISSTTSTFDQWIKNEEQKAIQSPLNTAIDWRSLEIKIAREQKKNQKKLFEDIPLVVDEDDKSSRLKAISEFLIHEEFKIPYYYGFSRIARISTANIEQFLEITAELFEQIISQLIKNDKNAILSAEKQENIIKKIAKQHWNQIPKKNINGRETEKFLESFKEFTRSETLQPNAPYAPGVTGIGIKRSQFKKIIDLKFQEKYPEIKTLASVLQTCLGQNYLKAHYEVKQGGKTIKKKIRGKTVEIENDDDVTVLYLNRLLCVHFGLPVGHGGWRYKKPFELCKWLKIKSSSKGLK